MARKGGWNFTIDSVKKVSEVSSWSVGGYDDGELSYDKGVCISFTLGEKNPHVVEIVIPLKSLTSMVDEVVREFGD